MGNSKRGLTGVIGAGAALGAVCCALAAGAGETAHAAHGTAAPRANVLVVQSDDQTTPSVRFMRHVTRQIARRGTTFSRELTNWPLCCPSRATLQTGQYAHNHGVLGNHGPRGGFGALDASNTLAVWLDRAGYATAHVGKFMNGYGGKSTRRLVPPGWDEWYTAIGVSQAVYDYDLNQNGRIVHYGRRARDYKGDVITRKALGFIRRRAPRKAPFFLQVDYTAPHTTKGDRGGRPPHDCGSGASQPAPRHAHSFDHQRLPRSPAFNEADVSDKPAAIRLLPLLTRKDISGIQRQYRCRLESLLHVDEGVGRMIGALRKAGELKDTLIVFTSDNAIFQGEHRIRNGKQRVYEDGIRVPLVIRGPGFPPDQTVAGLTTNADLAPTIVAATGATPGLVVDGRPLQEVAASPAIDAGRAILIETDRYKAVRTDRFAYVENGGGAIELYDLALDPYELENVAGDASYSTAQSHLAVRLDQLRDCAGEECLDG